jgi:hypothetical protein
VRTGLRAVSRARRAGGLVVTWPVIDGAWRGNDGSGDLATRAQSESSAEQDPSDYDSLAGAVDFGRLVAERGRREVLTEGRGVKRPG